jgi:L-ascorbate metabolism protein UlaG (beta-lactamase superfamily)
MDSYLDDPEAHAEAAKNPALAGGPFVRYETDRSNEIAALRDATCREQARLIELSGAIAALEAMVEQEAHGYSLEPLYEKVPAPLKGCVELAYDLRNHPSYRLLEPLLYGRFYNTSGQSLMLSLVGSDDRAFIFSTPRLDDPRSIHWQTPFASAEVDSLFRFRAAPVSCGELSELLGVHARDEMVAQLLTEREPPRAQRFPGSRWRYFGHACVLVETNGRTILTDPAFSYPFAKASQRFTLDDLPPFIDFVLLTHAHQDHVLLESLLQLRDRIGTILVPRNSGGALQDPSLKLILRACGFKHVTEVAEMDEIVDGPVRVRAIPFLGEHCDLAIMSKTAWLVEAGKTSILFAADSRNFSHALYSEVRAQTGDIGTVFVGMECDGAPLSWIYGPLLTKRLERGIDQSRRANASDCAGALALAEAVRCRELYVYAMGQEPWLNFISSIKYDEDSNPIIESDQLVRTLRQRGINAERLFGSAEKILA